MKRAAFLDRDGVINRSILINGHPKPPKTTKEVEIIEGVPEAIAILKSNDIVPVIITNQPDVARGITSQGQIKEINSYIGAMANIDYFYTCFHDDLDLCICRKPKPGLIYQSANELNLDIANSFVVGDRWRDISAGQEAGCQTFFINYLYPEKQPEMPFTAVSSLLEAVRIMTREPYGTK
jgi:D-glycero-D-manno-heptose 1,7-bisphosphate phosphatase